MKKRSFKSIYDEVKNASTIGQIGQLYGQIIVAAAAVNEFDFDVDHTFYAVSVDGDLESARNLTLGRFRRARNAKAVLLRGDALKKAVKAYKVAHNKWLKKNPPTNPYPYLVKVEKGVAYYSNKKPKRVKTPLGSSAKSETPFD
jgi:hypothetical protein